MKYIFLACVLAIGASCSHKSKKKAPILGPEIGMFNGQISQQAVSDYTREWPTASQAAINSTLRRYGLPNQLNKYTVVWEKCPPFKTITVYAREASHNFPTPHVDVIEHAISYKVPTSKLDELADFDGSIKYDRTRGILTASSDKEEMNFLGLNLADEIVRDNMSVKSAREELAKSAAAFDSGNSTHYTSAINFQPQSMTADTDQSTIKARTERQAEEAREIEEVQGSMESDNLEN